MADIIRAFFQSYWQIIIPVIATIFLAIPIIVYWYEFRYWLMKVRMRLPMAGRINQWIKNPGDKEQPTAENPKAAGFFVSETELCSFYETYYRDHQPSEENFRRNQDYLGKINEDGRREKGLGLWGLIIVLMLIEASAFGFALAPFALTMATPNTAMAGAFALGLVISIIGLFLSEFAGRALYKNSVVNHVLSFENMRQSGTAGDMVRTHIVTIDNTHIDDSLPQYQQILNRVKIPKDGEKPAKSFGVLIGYGVFIVGLAIAAFWVRTETLNAQEAQLIENPTAIVQAGDDFPTAAADDFPMPDEMIKLSAKSATKSAQDQIDSMHRASLVTFAVLSGLFIFIQVTSTYLAFIYGFAGTHSRKAWELTHKFSSASDFVRYHASKARSVATDARSTLGMLQGLQIAKFRANGTDREQLRKELLNRTFEVFIAEQDAKKAHKDQKAITDQLNKNGLAVIQKYIEKTQQDLEAAIDVADNVRIAEIVRVALPRINAITDPALANYKNAFLNSISFLSAAADAPADSSNASSIRPPPAPGDLAAKPAVESVTLAVELEKTVAFDHNAWGDLTAYQDDDMDYVAGKKGVAIDTIKRARRLQLLDKQGA